MNALCRRYSPPIGRRGRFAWPGFLSLGFALLTAGPSSATSFTEDPVYAPSGTYNSIAVDSFGNVHMATYDPFSGDLIYVSRTPLGLEITETVASIGNVGQYCSIALDPSGAPAISYYDATLGQLWFASRAGGAWALEPADDVSGDVGSHSSLAIDRNGNAHICYGYGDSSSNALLYAFKSGGMWTHLNIGDGIDGDIAVDRYGRIHFAYANAPEGNATSIYYQIKDGPNSDITVIGSPGNGGGYSGSASIAVDVSGNPHVSYVGNCVLHYTHPDPGGVWNDVPVDASGIVRATSIALDPDGEPRIAYQLDTTGVCDGIVGFAMDLWFAERTRGYWVRSLASSGGGIITGYEPDLAIDNVGDPVIAFGSSLPQLMLARGALLNARYLTPNTIRPSGGIQTISIVGSSVVGAPTDARLVQGEVELTAVAYAAVLGGGSLEADFDLTGAPTGTYTLYLQAGAAADTVEGALVIHDEVADLTRLTLNPSPEITPMLSNPGSVPRLLFASGREGGQELFVRDLNGFTRDYDAYRVTALGNSGFGQFPSWSPDGSRFVFHEGAGNELHVLELATGYTRPPLLLSTDDTARNPSWNPNTDDIAYDNGNSLWMIDPAVNVPTGLLAAPGATLTDPDWDPSGQFLAFTYDNLSVLGRGLQTARIFPPGAPGGAILIPEDGFQNIGPQWSPDGKWVAFTSDRAGLGEFDVYVTDSGGRGWILPVTQTPGNESQVSWGQDGQSLAFIGTYGGVEDVFSASNLPMFQDGDEDGVPDAVDDCVSDPTLLVGLDRDGDGCDDPGFSFRFTRYWGVGRFPVTYETTPQGDPEIGNGSEFNAIANGFAAWSAAAPAELAFVNNPAGMENAVSGDGRNSLTFTDRDGFIVGTVAITYSTVAVEDTVIDGRLFRPGEVVDADILFNTLHYDFSTPTAPGPAGAFDLGSVATHEIGHFIGEGHSSIRNSTMFYVAFRGPEQQTLEGDDTDVLPVIYRGDGLPVPPTHGGMVVRGEDLESPVVGAAVLAISDEGDTLKMAVTGEDGRFIFYGLPPCRFFVTPLNGSPSVNGLRASNVTPLLTGVADLDFLEEFYDGPDESNSDYGLPGYLVTTFPTGDINIITNPDLSGPMVVSTFPTDTSVDIAATTAIKVTFDEAIRIDSVPGNLTLTNQTTSIGVAGNAAFLSPSNTLVFTPTAPLDFSTLYVLDIGPGITDLTGNPMSDNVVAQFTTQAQPPVAILGASPRAVPVGGVLVLSGTGFSPTPGDNQVDFPGATTTPFAATLEALYVTVPGGATSGDVTVTVNAQTSNPFPVEILPGQAPPVGVPLGDAPLAGDPRKVTVVPDGTWAYVATTAGVTAVSALPTAADFLSAVDIPLGGGSRGVAAAPDGDRVFAVSSSPPFLHTINSDPTAGALFNTVVASVSLPAEPLDIVVVPGGSRALVSFAGRVVSYSLVSGPGFGQEVREWTTPGTNFLGDLGVAADGTEAYAATTAGQIAVLGLGMGEGIVTSLAAGTTPRESAGP